MKEQNLKIKGQPDFTEGPLFVKMILYTIPIILTGLLQLSYNMADNMIIGKFSDEEFALAAVGATNEVTSLILILILGIGAGASIVVAQAYGAKDTEKISRSVHTSITFSMIGGVIFAFITFLLAAPILRLMEINPAFIDKSILYVRICSLGVPAVTVANFAGPILRSIGDSRTPLIFFICSALINVGLNLLFVAGLGMDVDGVAYATVISQYFSAAASLLVLIKRKNTPYAFSFKKMCIDKKILLQALRYGIPQGIQSAMFSISNMMVISSMNTFNGYIYTGYTISNNINNIVNHICNGCASACLTFTAQNYGARNKGRINKVLLYSLLQVVIAGILIGQLVILLNEPLAMLYIRNDSGHIDEILGTVKEITTLLLSVYFLYGIMGVLSSSLRGLGRTIAPMLTYVIGLCGIRILWVLLVFPSWTSPIGLMTCYPVSWFITAAVLAVMRLTYEKRLKSMKADSSVSE